VRWQPVNGGEEADDICIIAETGESHSAAFGKNLRSIVREVIPLIPLDGPTGGGGENNVVFGTETHTVHDLDGSTVIQWMANMRNNMGHPAEFYASTSSIEPRGAPVVIQPGHSGAHIGYQDDYIQQLYLSIKWLS
jgi:hypothetical protein